MDIASMIMGGSIASIAWIAIVAIAWIAFWPSAELERLQQLEAADTGSGPAASE